ncbi:MAG: aspartate kinase [Proteobacteria bacterium]|nr:aspartate kinase [Pseudomonadota bacterium]
MKDQLNKKITKPIRVVKFGGTSVASTERLTAIAHRIQKLSPHFHIIIVVSAMSGVTNQLVSFCDHMAPNLKDEEVDVVLASGEQVTSGLLSLKLKSMGIKSCSLMSWQFKLLTSLNPTQARIEDMDANYLLSLLLSDTIPVIAGFQGINQDQRTTTLGRGGSDTTAVAVAAAVQNRLLELSNEVDIMCDIYTDVDGIYTADPRFVRKARKLTTIPAPFMLELAQAGSKVLHPRSVQLALKHNVNVRVLSSFKNDEDNEGTLIDHTKDNFMENSYIYGIAHQQNEYLLNINGSVLNIQKILKEINGLYIHSDLLTLNSKDDRMHLTCMILDRDVANLKKYFEKEATDIEYSVATNKVKITLVGVGLQNDCDILNKIYKCCDHLNVVIDLLSVTELKISLVVDQSFTISLLQKLHEVFIES